MFYKVPAILIIRTWVLNVKIVYVSSFVVISTEVVSFGTTVKLKDLVTQKVVSYTFVGPVEYELEIYPSIVTFSSPLGKALVGKKKGESVDIELPKPSSKFLILDIEAAS